MKGLRTFLKLIVASFVIFFYLGDVRADEKPAPVKIGGAFALTGIASSFGAVELNGAKLAVDEVNASGGVKGAPVELVVEDTASTNVQTVNAITKLLSIDKVNFIVGPTWLDSFAGALPIARSRGAILITPSAAVTVLKKNESDFPFAFSTFFNLEKEFAYLLQHVKNQGLNRVAFFFDQDPFNEGIRELVRKQASSLSLKEVGDFSFQFGHTDFKSALARAKKEKAEAVVFNFSDQAALLAFLKQTKENLPGVRAFGSHDLEGYVTDPSFSGLLKGVVWAIPEAPSAEFQKAYQERFKTAPLLTAGNAYDAVKILVQVLSEVSSPDEVIARLRSGSFPTVSFGSTGFDSRGGIAVGNFTIHKD